MSRSTHPALRGARLSSLATALSLAVASGSLGAANPTPFGHRSHANHQPPAKYRTSDFRKFYAAALKEFESLPGARPTDRAPATVRVASMDDSGAGTLRDALSHAVDGDVIDLTGLRGTLTLTAPLVPAAKVSINGPGRDLLTLDGNHLDRVLMSSHSLRVSSVTIANGATPHAALAAGGCLFVRGAVTLNNTTLSNCSVDGTVSGFAYGGAVLSVGSISVESSTLMNNSVAAQYQPGGDISKPYLAVGGAILAVGTPYYRGITTNNSTFTGNSAIGSHFAYGGAIASVYNSLYDAVADVTLNNTTVSGNTLNTTGIAPYYSTTYHATVYPGLGFGAGVAVVGGNVNVVASHIDNNRTTSSSFTRGAGLFVNYGVYYDYNSYNSYNVGGALTVTSSTISGNTASSIYDGIYGAGLTASNDISIEGSVLSDNHAMTVCPIYCFSAGGAVASGTYTQKLSITASTLSGNSVATSVAGYASGGAVTTRRYDKVGTAVAVINSTVSGNTTTSGLGFAYGAGICQQISPSAGTLKIYNSTVSFNVADGFGGGIVVNGNLPAALYSTIVANNTSAAYAGASDIAAQTPVFTIGGDYNLVQTDPGIYGVTLSGTHNIVGADPLLKPLANNGGGTLTHALDPDSPAVDKGANPLTLSFDQRGSPYPRVVGASADIGAFELDTDHIFGDGFD